MATPHHLTQATFQHMYQRSITEPNAFWRDMAQRINWIKAPNQIQNCSFSAHEVSINWYQDGQLNASVNCIDRHLPEYADKPAIIWEGDEEDTADNPQLPRVISYQDLHDRVCQIANALKAMGVKKGDIVTLYMPMVPEAIMSMLACCRIGAVHSVVFAGFSPEALAGRIRDGQSRFIITADIGKRGGKLIPLKYNVNNAVDLCSDIDIQHILVLAQAAQSDPQLARPQDLDFNQLVDQQAGICSPAVMDAESPLFVLYTSGSTGKPKGVVHTTGGYLVYASLTHHYVFDHSPDDIYWCMADIGWITGHSYSVYGPLSNGATCVMYEGIPNYPDSGRLGRIIDRHQVNTLYTAPTVIRALMADADTAVRSSKRQSLRLLGSAGEPINPEAWHWFYQKFGGANCPIMDTWWQTETGGLMITPIPGVTPLKAGAATQPFFGIEPALVDDRGTIKEGETDGNLVIRHSWPGQMRTVLNDHQRFIDTYFKQFDGFYFSGDGARRDADGDYWVTGRVDDVLNVSGHRLGTAELESALVAHPAVAEAAVVGFPHAVKGEGIYIYVSPRKNITPSDRLIDEFQQRLRQDIGALAKADHIQWTQDLPKTRSGKIMRRILRKIAADDFADLGDISTLADPQVVQQLISGHQTLMAATSAPDSV